MLSFEEEKFIFCNIASGVGISGCDAEHGSVMHSYHLHHGFKPKKQN